MFWEMCNLEQEFTRVDSMVTLLKLYFHHQNNMSEGYFNVKGKNASAVLNPGEILTLIRMMQTVVLVTQS